MLGKTRTYLLLLGLVTIQPAWAVTIPAFGTPGGAQPVLDPVVPEPVKIPDLVAEQPKLEQPSAKANATKLPVTKIKLQDFYPHPKQGITRKNVDHMIDTLRNHYIKDHQRLTLGDIQSIANALTLFYRTSGFILSRVYVPSQDITHEKSVTLRVFEGRLGRVMVEDNKRYSDAQIKAPFTQMLGKPIWVGDIEHGLLSMNALPGLRGFSVFRPGHHSGESDIVLKVKQEKRMELIVGADNHGTSLSGRVHGFGGFTWNNPTGTADKFTFIGIQNMDPSNGTSLTATYKRPLFSMDDMLGISFSEGTFDLGGSLASSNISGKSTAGSGYWDHYFIRRRGHELISHLELKRNQGITIQAGSELNKDNRTNLTMGLIGIKKTDRGTHTGNIEWVHGFEGLLGATRSGNSSSGRQGASGEYAYGKFNAAKLDYRYRRRVGQFHILQAHLKGQYTRDMLASSDRFGLGGTSTVRAYPTNEYLFESGVLGQVEWLNKPPVISTWPVPFLGYRWGDIFHLVAFADYGTGWVVDPNASDDSQTILAGYGLGLRMTIPGMLTVKLEASKPFKWAKTVSDQQPVRYWFSFHYTPKFG